MFLHVLGQSARLVSGVIGRSASPNVFDLSLSAAVLLAVGAPIGTAQGQVYLTTLDPVGHTQALSSYDPTTGAFINTLATNSTLVQATTGSEFYTANGLTLSGGTLYASGSGFGIGGSFGTVTQYDPATGAQIGATPLVSGVFGTTGLNNPQGITITGNTLYVANFGNNKIGRYDATTGAPIGTPGSWLTFSNGLSGPYALAASGNNLYVANATTVVGQVGITTTTNTPSVGIVDITTGVYSTLIPTAGLLGAPTSLITSGNNLYVANHGTIEIFDSTTGALLNSSFITGLTKVRGLAIAGGELFVLDYLSNVVQTNGSVTGLSVNAYELATGAHIGAGPLISLPNSVALGLAVSVPAPGAGMLVGMSGLIVSRRRRCM